MIFINNGGPVKIRIGGVRNCHWVTIIKGESVELDTEVGRSYGFSVKTTEGQIGYNKVETKQIVSTDFFKELIKIKGIGKKTAHDITMIFPVREELIKTIRASTDDNELPFRDDVSSILEEIYGRA